MPVLDIASGQIVKIPAIQLTNGAPFEGVVRATDGETLILELDERSRGRVPEVIDNVCVLVWQIDDIQRACPLVVRNKTPRTIVGQIAIQERREAPRLRVDVQLTYEPVAPDKVKETADEVMARVTSVDKRALDATPTLRSNVDPITKLQEQVATLQELVVELMNRVDGMAAIMLGLQNGQTQPGDGRRPLSVVNLSSTGLGFVATEQLKEGDYLHLRVMLNTSPRTTIECVAVVVRSIALEGGQAAGGRWDIGVRFSHIHEGDREFLIHYLFKVQRRMLQDRKEARESLDQLINR